MYALATIFLNQAAGRTAPSAITTMWFFVAYYAIMGNIGAVALLAKWVCILQIVIGTIFFFVLQGDSSMQLHLGTPAEFALSIGLPTVVWALVYFWAKGQSASQSYEGTIKSEAEFDFQRVDTSLTSGVTLKKVLEAHPAESRSKYSPPSADQLTSAQILLEHDDQVKAIISGLSGMPKEIVDHVLIEIVAHPSEHPQTVRNRSLLALLGRPDMRWSEEFDLIVRKCKEANVDNVREFFRVFPVLSQRMAPVDVCLKIIRENKSQFSVISASGKEITVTQHGTNSYTLQSHLGQKTFATLDEVYDYLGTPIRKRSKKTLKD